MHELSPSNVVFLYSIHHSKLMYTYYYLTMTWQFKPYYLYFNQLTFPSDYKNVSFTSNVVFLDPPFSSSSTIHIHSYHQVLGIHQRSAFPNHRTEPEWTFRYARKETSHVNVKTAHGGPIVTNNGELEAKDGVFIAKDTSLLYKEIYET